jgi:hypothetical protein
MTILFNDNDYVAGSDTTDHLFTVSSVYNAAHAHSTFIEDTNGLLAAAHNGSTDFTGGSYEVRLYNMQGQSLPIIYNGSSQIHNLSFSAVGTLNGLTVYPLPHPLYPNGSVYPFHDEYDNVSSNFFEIYADGVILATVPSSAVRLRMISKEAI